MSFELPFEFDADHLRADLDQISSNEWRPHFNTAIYEGEWSEVVLRSIGGISNQIYPDPAAQ